MVFVRNAISTGLIFVVPPWLADMGVYDMFVVCGVLAAVIALLVVPLIIFGRRWRIQLAGKYMSFKTRRIGHESGRTQK